MAANAIPRTDDPRYKASSDQFTAFRAKFADVFGGAVGTSWLMQLAQELGLDLEHATNELKTTWPLMLPRGGFQEHVGPLLFKAYSETEVTSTPKKWIDGYKEDKDKHLSPGPTFLKNKNNAAMWAQAALAAMELHAVTTYLAGTSGTHSFDGASFFAPVGVDSKKINPKSSTSRLYGNHKALTLNRSNPVAFMNEVEKHFKKIPTPGENGYLKLRPAAVLTGATANQILRPVAKQPELKVTVKSGAGTQETTIANEWAGMFAALESLDLPDDKAIAFAKGPEAGVPHVIHTLVGEDELRGGEFMAAKDWQALTGSWMQPLITMLGLDSEHCQKYDEILVKAVLDAAMTLMCPWPVLLIDLTIV